MKGNSNSEPDRLQYLGTLVQVRWSIEQNDKENDDGEVVESWDYEYANCSSDSYANLVEGIIRTKYTADEVEAILANYAKKQNVLDYLKFQDMAKFRETSSCRRRNNRAAGLRRYDALSYCLSGGIFETLADRILKLGSSYETDTSGEVEMVTVYLSEIFDDDSTSLAAADDVSVEIIDLLDETV